MEHAVPAEHSEPVERAPDEGRGQAESSEFSQPSSSLRNRIIPGITVVLIVGLLGLLGYSLFGPSKESGGGVNVVGKLIVFKDRQAPTFSIPNFDGASLSLDQYRGKTVLLNFWQSTCVPCQQEAPVLEAFNKSRDPNVVLLGVNVWDPKSSAEDYINQYGMVYPSGIDKNGSVAIDYGVTGVPETYFISPDGKLAGKFSGPFSSVDEINGYIQELNRGQ